MRLLSQGRLGLLTFLMICALVLPGCERGGKDASVPGPDSTTPGRSSAEARPEAAETGERAPDTAPDFEITTFDGARVRLSELRGSPVVVNFWASWCGPCRLEAPVLKDAFEAYGKKGVFFVGVAVQDNESDSKAFIKEYGWSFPVGPDTNDDIMRAYRVFGIPKTFLIDSKGAVAFVVTGAVSAQVLSREIEKLLTP